jgi:hypothetical protein
MVKREVLILVVIVGLVLAGCVPDPRDEAEAYSMRLAAESRSKADELARQQSQAAFEQQQIERAAGEAARVAAVGRFWSIFGSVAVVAACLAVLAAAVGFGWGAVGTGRAVARSALVRANLIALPDVTRQYPLLITPTADGRFSLANPNTGSVAWLDVDRKESNAMIAAAASVALAGVIAREARRAEGVGNVRIIHPGNESKVITVRAREVVA